MSGDWIKVQKSTPRKPEVLRLAALLKIHPDHAFGICFRFWAWCDDNLENGNAVGVTDVMLDALLERDGCASALIEVGWLRVRNGSLEVPNYDRHLSENAKKRALSRNRTAESRSRKCNAASVTKALPEKRREEKNNNSLSHAKDLVIPLSLQTETFDAIWARWKQHLFEVRKDYSVTTEQHDIADLSRWEHDDAVAAVRYSIDKGARNLIKDGSHRESEHKPRSKGSSSKPISFEVADR